MSNITIGSDPEFVIMCGDKVENALEIFTRVFKEELECFEAEIIEPQEDHIAMFYLRNPAHHLNRYLNDANIDYLINNYKQISSEQFVKLFDYYGYKIKNILNNDIIEKDLLQISKKISDQILKEYLDEVIGSSDAYLKQLATHLLEKTDMKELYKILTDERKITYNDFIINAILEYYCKKDIPDIDILPCEMKEKIIENILDNWEYEYEPENAEHIFCSLELGCDGQSALGEMRPKFGNDPIEHFNEILKLMKKLSEALEAEIVCYEEDLSVKAGTIQGNYQLGGHIHIGYKELFEQPLGRVKLVATYLPEMLSIYVGIPLTLIEKEDEATRRHTSYGKVGASEGKDYGLEFRMPSSWLVSPEITIGALSLAYVVSEEYISALIKGQKTEAVKYYFDNVDKLVFSYETYLKQGTLKEYMLLKTKNIYENIKTMRLYPEYAEYIDYIFDMIENNETWNSDGDILTEWSKLF